MAKRLLLVIVLSFISIYSFSQAREEKESFWDKTYFGGSLALQFGTYTYIDLSPLMGYGFTERFSSGIGVTYQYVDVFSSYSAYGGRVFSRFGIIKNIFAHAEFEMLNWENRNLERQWSYSPFIGGGYSSHMGGQQGFQAYILYNLNYEMNNSSYDEPYVIRFSITF